MTDHTKTILWCVFIEWSIYMLLLWSMDLWHWHWYAGATTGVAGLMLMDYRIDYHRSVNLFDIFHGPRITKHESGG